MRFLIILFFGFFITRVGNAQDEVVFTRNIDSLIQQYIIENDLPSAAVGVVKGDSVLYEKRIFKELQNPSNENFQNIYNIASVAKPFVATAIMILIQEGKIDLKSPVIKYLPDFRIDSKHLSEITVEHLLTHTSGLPNTSSPTDYEYKEVDTTENALANHIKSLRTLKLDFKPGKKYSYSNVGFEVLGEIIVKVSGLSFDEFMNVNLFQPLNMASTSYILSDYSITELARPQMGHPYRETTKFPYNRAFSPSGNLFTNINDMNKWMIFNLNEGVYKGFKPFSENYFDQLMRPLFETEENEFIGLSWFTKNQLVYHDGKDLGYSSLLMLYMEQGIGITVLINHLDADCNELLNLVAKSIRF